MSERLIEQSELVAGLTWQGRISANKVSPRIFVAPFDEIMNDFLSGMSPEDIIAKHGNAPIQNAIYRAQGVNGLGTDVDQVQVLETLHSKYEAAQRLKHFTNKLENGKDVNWSELTEISQAGQVDSADYYKSLDEIVPRKRPFILTGYRPWDKLLGGMPMTGLIIVAGDPGSGKTSLCLSIMKWFVKQYPQKYAALNSIEMLCEEASMRAGEIQPDLTKEERSRVLISEHQSDPTEIINKASTVENLGLLVVDFADLLISGETTESAKGHIYRTLAKGSKSLRIPIILIDQLNRSTRDIPRPFHIRYSSMAEITASLILMVYNPIAGFREFEKSNEYLPAIPGIAWQLAWKCRGGFRVKFPHIEEGPFAFATDYTGAKGWGIQVNAKRYIVSLNKLSTNS